MEWYNSDLSSPSLTEEGTKHDKWLRDMWLFYSSRHQKLYGKEPHGAAAPRQKKRKKNPWQHIFIYVEGESAEPLTFKIRRKKYSLKDIKRLLADVIEVDDTWRYFFLDWSRELQSEIKDEIVLEQQIVPTYNSDITLYILMK